MAYTVMTEGQAAAREYGKAALSAIIACLEANAAVIKAGSRAVSSTTIYAGRRAEPVYPCIMVEPLSQEDEDMTMGGMGNATRKLMLVYRVYGFDNAMGQPAQTGATQIAQLADRIRAALVYNPTLDASVLDTQVSRATFGRQPGSFVQGCQMDVRVTREVARP